MTTNLESDYCEFDGNPELVYVTKNCNTTRKGFRIADVSAGLTVAEAVSLFSTPGHGYTEFLRGTRYTKVYGDVDFPIHKCNRESDNIQARSTPRNVVDYVI